MLHDKILKVISERDGDDVLRGKIQIDDDCLGGERPGVMAGRGPENKIPIMAAGSLNEAGHPIHAGITPLLGFSSKAIESWAAQNLPRDPHALRWHGKY